MLTAQDLALQVLVAFWEPGPIRGFGGHYGITSLGTTLVLHLGGSIKNAKGYYGVVCYH